ncbi:hypothetical protein [Flavobacterium sp. I3-2]|uniref:hypothetical protein n=1 Tax=Flavobacterium sp. I3-2 TaxID=2748319 RepID=UPI0015B02906|nr:hypothetical protein [Flavobacterium sp. I3-2]
METTRNIFKSVSILAIALMFGFGANAQNDNKIKTNKLSVNVGEFYSLNLSNDNATILLDSEAKFASGSESTPITMTIFSSRKYAVTAKVSSAQFNGTADNTSVSTNNIDLIVAKTSGNDEAAISNRTDNSLKHAAAEEIVASPKATKADVYSLVYAIPAANTSAFLDQYGKTITTEITYTLLPL